MAQLLWSGATHKQASSVRRIKTLPLLKLSAKDDAILTALRRYYYLTPEQVTRLFYSPGSLTLVKAKLKQFVERGYCGRLHFQEKHPAKARYVYLLARKGLRYLERIGIEASARYRPSEEEEKSDYFLGHTLACNDVFIAAELLPRAIPALRVHHWVHERTLRRMPVRVHLTTEGGTSVARPVIPDGFIELRHRISPTESEQHCIVLELDRDHEEQKRWRRKVAELVAYVTAPAPDQPSPYEAAFGTDVIIIAVVVAPKNRGRAERRRDELVGWTEKELTRLGAAPMANLFRFTAQPADADPKQFFLDPCWVRPFGSHRLPLLDLE